MICYPLNKNSTLLAIKGFTIVFYNDRPICIVSIGTGLLCDLVDVFIKEHATSAEKRIINKVLSNRGYTNINKINISGDELMTKCQSFLK